MKYLEKIQDKKLRTAVSKAYQIYGAKMFFLPSSLSGKYHPEDEHGLDGLKKHTEKVCWFLEGVCKEFKYSNEVRDILFTAAYFHDLGKVKTVTVSQELTYDERGKTKRLTKVIRNLDSLDLHSVSSAKLARQFLEEEGVPEETISIIYDLILRHMSHWIPRLPLPQTELERMFALADYIVAREEFKLEQKVGKWSKIKRIFKQ